MARRTIGHGHVAPFAVLAPDARRCTQIGGKEGSWLHPRPSASISGHISSAFQYHLGNSAGGAVGERQVDVLNAFSDTALLQIAVETQARFAQSVATHFDISPTHVLA